MSKFEIITITLSFIIGLGVAQLLSSFGAAVRERLEHPLHWMPFAWGLVILLLSIQFWFALFDLDSVLSDWSWLWYLQILALAIALFLAGTLILPTRVSSSKGGLREDFIAHGRYALLALAAYLLGWLPPNARMNDGNLITEPNVLNVAMAIVTLIVFKSRSNRTWLASTLVFYLIFLYAVLFVYSAPGA